LAGGKCLERGVREKGNGQGEIPPLRGLTRQNAARKKKSGRSGRDDRIGGGATTRRGRTKVGPLRSLPWWAVDLEIGQVFLTEEGFSELFTA